MSGGLRCQAIGNLEISSSKYAELGPDISVEQSFQEFSQKHPAEESYKYGSHKYMRSVKYEEKKDNYCLIQKLTPSTLRNFQSGG